MRYTEREAEEILRRAAARSVGGTDRETLLAAAREAGIDVADVEAAEREVLAERKTSELKARFLRDKRSGVAAQVLSYLVVVSLMAFFVQRQWIFWVAGIWGISVLKAIVTEIHPPASEFERWRKKIEAPPLTAESKSELDTRLLAEEGALQAIKLHREETGADLVTSKEYVDKLYRMNGRG